MSERPVSDARVSRRPLFSILTSVFRTECYLTETIDSVLAQTLPDWEMIVVDNGMSDEVVRIVERYADDPRIRLLRQENKGLGGGIDAAAATATGRYFAVLDSDDLLMPEFCERTAAVLWAEPSIDVVGIDAAVFTDGDSHDQIRSYRRSVGATAEVGLHRRVTLAEMVGGEVLYYTAAIRAEAWALGQGYSCDTPKVEDLALFMRMLIAGCDIRVLNDRLARYRLRTDSSSRGNDQVEMFEDSLERAFLKAAVISDAPDVERALRSTLRRIRYDRSMRRARVALLDDDVITALIHARRAFAERRSARPAVVAAGLMVAPRMLKRIHPTKQRITRFAVLMARSARGFMRQGTRRSPT